jgi:hypothetical protein
MTSTAPITSADLAHTSFAYVDSDVPAGLSLGEWRRQRDAARRAERRARRRFRTPRLRPAWSTA